jgi:hypothetical protein
MRDGASSAGPVHQQRRGPKRRAQIRTVGLGCPADHGLPFSTSSRSKLAGFLVAEGVVEDVFEERRHVLLREQGVSLPGRQDREDPH